MAEAVKREFLLVTSSHCTQEEVVRLKSAPKRKRRSKAGDHRMIPSSPVCRWQAGTDLQFRQTCRKR